MLPIIKILYAVLQAFGLVERLLQEHQQRQKAEDIANAPQTKAEITDYFDGRN